MLLVLLNCIRPSDTHFTINIIEVISLAYPLTNSLPYASNESNWLAKNLAKFYLSVNIVVASLLISDHVNSF